MAQAAWFFSQDGRERLWLPPGRRTGFLGDLTQRWPWSRTADEDAPKGILGRGAAMPTSQAETVPEPAAASPDGYLAEAPELDVEELFDADGWIDPEDLPDDPVATTWGLGPDPDGPEPSAGDLTGAAEVFGDTDPSAIWTGPIG
jgi:hypothetical protein